MSVDLQIKGLDYSATPIEAYARMVNGGLVGMDWRQALIARGYGWAFNVGTFSTQTDTGITGGGAGTILDADQPEFTISIPTGYVCIPLCFHIAARPGLATTDSHVNDILIAVDRAAAVAADGTFTAVSPYNMRTNIAPGSCPLTVRQAYTADVTDPTAASWVELYRATKLTDVQGTAATVNLQELVGHYEPVNPPIIIGPASIWGYWGGSIAVVGFAQCSFLAMTSTEWASLA